MKILLEIEFFATDIYQILKIFKLTKGWNWFYEGFVSVDAKV